MMGKTHFKIGILSYCVILTIPLFVAIPYVAAGEISLVQIIIAGIAALMPDADSQHSYINRLNPVTGAANRAVDVGEDILIKIISLSFTLGIGGLILFNPGTLVKIFTSAGVSYNKSLAFTYFIGAILVLLGIIGVKGEKILKRIPIVGNTYASVIKSAKNIVSFIRKYVLKLIYSGVGIWIILYNLNKYRDFNLYLIGLIFIGISIFPHRSFLHSIEGIIAMTIAVHYLSSKIGYSQATPAFFIGYFSHLYLADIFTKEGVPLSIMPRILKKSVLHTSLRRSKLYKIIYKILDIRLVIPIMSTGSRKGDLFENSYVLALTATFIIAAVKYNVEIGFL